MQKIISFRQSLEHFLEVFDKRFNDGDYLGALSAARSAVEQAKTRVKRDSVNLLIGQTYYEMGLYLLSCEHFFRAILVSEVRVSAYFGIGRNLVLLNHPNLALEYFSKCLEYDMSGEMRGAVLEWTHIIKENLTDLKTEPMLAIASNLASKGKCKESLLILEPAVRRGDRVARIMYAECLLFDNKIDDAREMILGVLKEEESVKALLVLCEICKSTGDDFSLSFNLERLERFNLSYRERERVALFYCELRNFEKAEQIFSELTLQDEYNVKLLLYLAICQYNLGKHKEALYTISQAHWVDIENATIGIYYDIINRKTINTLCVQTNLPKDLEQEIIEHLLSLSGTKDFCSKVERSGLLMEDVEWAFHSKNMLLSKELSKALAESKSKHLKQLYKRLLLSVRLNKEQKFHLTRNAILSGNFRQIDLVSGLKFTSFYVNNKFVKSSAEHFAIADAVGFASVYGVKFNFNTLRKLNGVKLEAQYSKHDGLLSCLYFGENKQDFKKACIYFGVDENIANRAYESVCLKKKVKGDSVESGI